MGQKGQPAARIGDLIACSAKIVVRCDRRRIHITPTKHKTRSPAMAKYGAGRYDVCWYSRRSVSK